MIHQNRSFPLSLSLAPPFYLFRSDKAGKLLAEVLLAGLQGNRLDNLM